RASRRVARRSSACSRCRGGSVPTNGPDCRIRRRRSAHPRWRRERRLPRNRSSSPLLLREREDLATGACQRLIPAPRVPPAAAVIAVVVVVHAESARELAGVAVLP